MCNPKELFKDHILEITKDEFTTIHHFHIPDSVMLSIKFINTNGLLIVTGDFGNWLFNRPFVPSADGHVNIPYWLEKLKMGSLQSAGIFDGDLTAATIKEYLEEADDKFSDKELVRYKEYLNNCLEYVGDGETVYCYHAYYADIPNFLETEDVPYAKKLDSQLEIVFAAFDEICSRLKAQKEEEEKAKKMPRIHVIKCRCGSIIASCPEPLCFTDPEWRNIIQSYFASSDKFFKVLDSVALEYKPCNCQQMPLLSENNTAEVENGNE